MRQRHLFFMTLLLFFSLFSCSDKIEPGTTERPPTVLSGVSLATARMIEHPLLYEAVGTVTAGISSNLSSKLMGVIEDLRVREGDRVRKGDVLVVIDPRRVEANERKAEAALAESRKSLSAAVSAREAAKSSKELHLLPSQKVQLVKSVRELPLKQKRKKLTASFSIEGNISIME